MFSENFTVTFNMATNESGRIEELPQSCQGCYLSYGDFVGTYFNDSQGLLKLLMSHGLLPEKKNYVKSAEKSVV